MDSIQRIFGLVNEAKKKGKSCIPSHSEKKGGKRVRTGEDNPNDHDHKMSEGKSTQRLEPQRLKRNQYGKDIATKRLMTTPSTTLAGMKDGGAQLKAAATRSQIARARGQAKANPVNASTEIANILNLIKEAYQDELISEEAFLAIADPILRSLMEEDTPEEISNLRREYAGHGKKTTKRSNKKGGGKVPKRKRPPTPPKKGKIDPKDTPF